MAAGPAPVAVEQRAEGAAAAARRRLVAVRGRVATAAVACAYALGAILAFSQLDPLSRTSLPGGGTGDAVQMAWFLALVPHILAHGDPFVTHLLDHPAAVDLADNTGVPLLGLLAAPVTLTLGPVAALNLLLRLALATSAWAAYGLARRLGASRPPAFVAGAVYAFGPFAAAHASPGANLDLIAVPLPPLAIAALVELVAWRRRPAWAVGLALGAIAAAQLLVDPEVLAELTVTCLVAGAVLALGEIRRRRRLFGAVRSLARRLAVAGAAGLPLVAIAAAGPLWAMFDAPGHLSGPVQPPPRVEGYHLVLAELVLPPARQLVDFASLAAAGRAAVGTSSFAGGPEHGGYLGVPLLLLCAALAWRARREAAMRLALALGASALLLELGTRLAVAGSGGFVPLPGALLERLPLLDSAIPARFALEVALGAALVLATGLEHSRRRIGRDGRATTRGALLAGATVAAVACYLPSYPLSSEQLPADGAVLAALRDHVGAGAVVLTYPYALPPYDEAMLWQAQSGMRFVLMGGYATVPGSDGAGQWWPPLLRPPAVQEALEWDETGRSLHYPPPVRGAAAAELCEFARRYGVDDVVMRLGRKVPRAARAERLFAAALGRPLVVGGGALVWAGLLGATDRCHAGAGTGSDASGNPSTSGVSSAPSRG